jgi:hypothetical protein
MWIRKKMIIVVNVMGILLITCTSVKSQQTTTRVSSFKKATLSYNVGAIKEWKVNTPNSCVLPNTGLSNAISFSSFVSENWFVMGTLHLDVISDKTLNDHYAAGSYQISMGRTLLKRDIHKISTNIGVALTQELLVSYQCLDLGNGPEPSNFSNKRMHSTFFSLVGLEYEQKISGQWSLGLRVDNYYDFVGFGRTDFTGFLRFNLLSKKEDSQYFK